ncbi:hypothetical protein B0H10DRAFT_1943248 [Mycena sp. CBHHK59/15]|nr:hypothetical protein B0H10DRAFT_1943248 [Mycena sp. CBHHK59/15]
MRIGDELVEAKAMDGDADDRRYLSHQMLSFSGGVGGVGTLAKIQRSRTPWGDANTGQKYEFSTSSEGRLPIKPPWVAGRGSCAAFPLSEVAKRDQQTAASHWEGSSKALPCSFLLGSRYEKFSKAYTRLPTDLEGLQKASSNKKPKQTLLCIFAVFTLMVMLLSGVPHVSRVGLRLPRCMGGQHCNLVSLPKQYTLPSGDKIPSVALVSSHKQWPGVWQAKKNKVGTAVKFSSVQVRGLFL